MTTNKNKSNPLLQGLLKVALIITGPIWLILLYWPWQLIVGLFGVCYYLTVERTRNVIFPAKARRQIIPRLTWWSIPLILIGLIPAMAIQLIVAIWHLFIWWFALLGRWQTGFANGFLTVIFGIITQITLLLVFIGSFHHPLPWLFMGYDSVPNMWYRFEAVDPVRMLLTGPVIFGAFWLLLVPTLLSGLKPKLKKFTFLPCIALSLYVLFTTLKATDPDVNQSWAKIGICFFIGLGLLALMVMGWKTLHRSSSMRQFVWFFAIRLLEKKRIALFSLAAVTLCTAMLLIIVSVMGGFVEQVRNKSHGLMGDIIIEGDQIRGFPHYDKFIEFLKSPEMSGTVEDATPIVFTAGLMRVQKPYDPTSSWTNPVQIQGIKLEGKIAVSKFRKGLSRYNSDQKDQIILDKKLSSPYNPEAEKLFGMINGLDIYGLAYRDPEGKYHRNTPPYTPATLSVIPITRKGTLVDPSAPALTQKFYMIDDSRTGVYDIDSRYTYVDFTALQNLLYMNEQEKIDGGIIPARTHQIQIKLKPGVKLYDEGLAKIQTAWYSYAIQLNDPLLQDVQVNTWEEYNKMFISAVENEKRLMIILFSIISVVSVFLILAIFYMIVVEKTRDIGILKSIGASASQIAAIFLAYAGAIGFVGSISGTVLGYYFVKNINEVQDWLIDVFGWRVWNREIYAFDRIPGEVQFSDVQTIIIAAILASIIGAVIPAIRAAKMNPVESLRYE